MRATLAVALALVLLVGLAVLTGTVSLTGLPRSAVAAAPTAIPTPNADQIAAQAQLIVDESQLCNCGR